MILEVLYFAAVINMGMQQESFDEQDDHERQYEYESRYYAKPEDKRSAVGKFTLLKVKGEIRNDDNMLDPLFASVIPGRKLMPDMGVSFPLPLLFSPPHPFLPPLVFPHPHNQEYLDRPQDGDITHGGHFIAMSKILAGLPSPTRPMSPFGGPFDHPVSSSPYTHHQDGSWSRFSNSMDHNNAWNPAQSNHDTPAGRFFDHITFSGDHGFGSQQGHRPQDYESGDGQMTKEDGYPMFQENFKHDGGNQDQGYFPQWSSEFKKEKGKSKATSRPTGSMFNQEPVQFDCPCRPFTHDWSRLKRCIEHCGSMPYNKRKK